LTPLAALAERYNVAILAVLHLTKSAQRKILLRAQASVAFVAQARTVLAVGVDPEQPGRRLLVTVKNNLCAFAPGLAFRITDAGLHWEAGTVAGTAEDLLAGDDPGTRTERKERESAKQFLRDTLAGGPMASTDVYKDARANGIAQRTLWRAKAELGVVAERPGLGPWYWMLPAPREATP
jgi:putative DNA primase/helicase